MASNAAPSPPTSTGSIPAWTATSWPGGGADRGESHYLSRHGDAARCRAFDIASTVRASWWLWRAGASRCWWSTLCREAGATGILDRPVEVTGHELVYGRSE